MELFIIMVLSHHHLYISVSPLPPHRAVLTPPPFFLLRVLGCQTEDSSYEGIYYDAKVGHGSAGSSRGGGQ